MQTSSTTATNAAKKGPRARRALLLQAAKSSSLPSYATAKWSKLEQRGAAR